VGGLDVLVVVEDNAAPADARNKLVLAAQSKGAQHLLMVDSDMGFPDDALIQLHNRGKDIVGATARRRRPPFQILGKWDEKEVGLASGLHRAEVLGTGLILIDMNVFEQIEPPWFHTEFYWNRRDRNNPKGYVSEDTYFVSKAKLGGIDTYVDLKLSEQIVHIGDQDIGWSLQ